MCVLKAAASAGLMTGHACVSAWQKPAASPNRSSCRDVHACMRAEQIKKVPCECMAKIGCVCQLQLLQNVHACMHSMLKILTSECTAQCSSNLSRKCFNTSGLHLYQMGYHWKALPLSKVEEYSKFRKAMFQQHVCPWPASSSPSESAARDRGPH